MIGIPMGLFRSTPEEEFPEDELVVYHEFYRCPICGAEVPDWSQMCQDCGHQIIERR